MRIPIATTITVLLLCGCSDQPSPTSGDSNDQALTTVRREEGLSTEGAKELIPEAASIVNEDFESLSTTPDPTKINNQTLSLVLFSLNPFQYAENNTAALDDFKYVADRFPKPSDIAEAMWRSKSKGYATMIQPEFIRDCKCTTENGIATGTVTFAAEGLYSGTVEFTARLHDTSWQIDEFRLPNYGIKTVRDKDRKWNKSSLESNGE